jgi:hypothetical protein
MEIRLYTELNEVLSIREEWYELAETLGSASLTQYPDYTLACFRAFKRFRSETNIGAVFDQNRLIAVIPFRLVINRAFRIPIRILEFPEYPTPVRDILIHSSASRSEIFHTFLSEIESIMGSSWDYASFRGILESSVLLQLARQSDRSSLLQDGYSHLLDTKTDGYVDRVLNSKARNNLRRNRKKLEAMGEFEYQSITAFPQLKDAYQAFLKTEAAGWKSVTGGKRAVALHDDQTTFYYDLVLSHANLGRSHIHILLLNGQPIASDFCILTSRSCYSLKHGYDEKYSNVSPSNLLRAYTLDYYGKSDVIDSIDLVSGAEWHLTWRPKRRRVFAVRFYNNSLRGFFFYLAERTRQRLIRRARERKVATKRETESAENTSKR